MKILLLGAKGMLGQALAREFAGEELTAWDKEELDITDRSLLREKITVLKPEVVINAAAYTAVDAAEENRDVAFAVNAEAVRHIAAAAKEIDATVVHYSTDYVFPSFAKASEGEVRLWDSNGKFLGFPEDYPPGPAVNAYGESKLAGEEALQKSGARFYLLRTAWLYGAGGKNFVDTMLRLAAERPELRVVNDQYGSPTYTRDVAHATRQVLAGFEPGIYHATNSGTATWYELAKAACALAGKTVAITPITSAEYPLPARRPQYSILKNTKGPALRDWQEALKEYIKERDAV